MGAWVSEGEGMGGDQVPQGGAGASPMSLAGTLSLLLQLAGQTCASGPPIPSCWGPCLSGSSQVPSQDCIPKSSLKLKVGSFDSSGPWEYKCWAELRGKPHTSG